MLTGNSRGLTEMEFNRIIQENSQGPGEVAPWLRAYTYREAEFSSKHPYWTDHNCLQLRLQEIWWTLLGCLGRSPPLHAHTPVHMHACAHAQRCIIKRNIKTINQVEKAELQSEIYREWTWGIFFFTSGIIVWIFCRQKDSFGTRHCTNCEEHCQTDAQDPPSTACSFWVLAHLQELKNTIVWKDRSASK